MNLFVFSILSIIWGSTWLVIKVGLEELTPFWFATGRFVIATIPLIALVMIRKRPLPRATSDWGVIAASGFLIFSVNYALVFWGETHISSGLAAVLYTFLPLFGMVISHYYRRVETFTLKKLSGIVMGILGVGLIFQSQLGIGQGMAIWGCAAILMAALGTSMGTVLIKAHGTHIDTIILTAGQMVLGLIPLILLALIFEPVPDLASLPSKSWLGMAYLGLFGSALSFVLANWLIKRMPVTTTQLIPFASTLLAVWLGALILNEPFHKGTTLGGVLVMVGMLVATRPAKNPKPLVS